MTWTNSAISLAAILAVQIALIVFGFGIEQLRPAGPHGISCIRLNIAYVAALRVIYAALYPLSVGLTTLMVNALGGGLIELPASGVGLALAVPCYALAIDGGEYLFHRAQHRIPFLWAMHSLHHSDPAVNVSTAPRHFWGEMLLKAVTIYTVIGLIFKANTVVVAAYTFFGLYNYVLHMNLRIGFGRWQPLLNGPQAPSSASLRIAGTPRLQFQSVLSGFRCALRDLPPARARRVPADRTGKRRTMPRRIT